MKQRQYETKTKEKLKNTLGEKYVDKVHYDKKIVR